MSSNNDLPASWEVKRLGDFVTTEKGKKPRFLLKEISEDFQIPYVNIKAFEQNVIDEYTNGEGCVLCEDGDFLMVWDGSRSGYVGKAVKGALGSTLVRIKFPGISQDYAYYFLQSKYVEINTRAKGVGIPHVDPSLVWNYNFPIPPLSEQHRIVSKIEELFSDLDKGIESLKNVQQQLKVYRLAVLKAAFEGKLSHKGVKSGELPKDWHWVTIGDIFQVYVGSTPSRKKSSYWNGDINWISSGEVAFCNIYSTKEKITEQGLNNSSCKLHPAGTVILAMIGEGKTRGQSAILKIAATHNQNTAAIRVPENVYYSELLYYFLFIKYEENRRIGSGNNQKALNKERVKSISIPLIPFKEQSSILQEIESRLSVYDKVEETINNSLKQSEALRQSILKKAFEGKLVPQDPNDEPASVLLERIKATKLENHHPKRKTKRVTNAK